MPKKQLTEAISVDEVFLGMKKDKKYVQTLCKMH